MSRTIFIFAGLLIATNAARAVARGPQSSRVVDRIVAQIEGDIILQSQVRELAAFQQLIEGRAEGDDRLLSELIEQWVVQTEATASHFPEPAQSEVDRELGRLTEQFGSSTAYAGKLAEVGLSATQIRQLLTRQIYVERFLDYKFRPSVRIESADIETYYRNELLPQMAKQNQPAPALPSVEKQIRELLTQRAINDLASKWLDETKSRLKIEIKTPAPNGGAP